MKPCPTCGTPDKIRARRTAYPDGKHIVWVQESDFSIEVLIQVGTKPNPDASDSRGWAYFSAREWSDIDSFVRTAIESVETEMNS